MPDSKPSPPAQSSVWKAIKPFVNGGLSGMGATCIIQPVDMVKVRIQIGATGSPVCRLKPAPIVLRVLFPHGPVSTVGLERSCC